MHQLCVHHQQTLEENDFTLFTVYQSKESVTYLDDTESFRALEFGEHSLEKVIEVLSETIPGLLDQCSDETANERRGELTSHGVEELAGHLDQVPEAGLTLAVRVLTYLARRD